MNRIASHANPLSRSTGGEGARKAEQVLGGARTLAERAESCYLFGVPLTRWLKATLDFCFPGVCAACGEECDGGSQLCTGCAAALDTLMTAAACGRCASPLAYPDAPCPHCEGKGRRPFARIAALGRFGEPLRAIIHHIKYHRAWPLAEYLADVLADHEPTKGLLTGADVLIPIPLHPLRQWSRGYNQSAVISARLASRCSIRHDHALIRVHHTETQTHMPSRARREINLKGAFALRDSKAVTGKHVVLIDDVRTSGATLRSAATTLRPAKPASLSAIVLAVADPRGRDFG